MSDLAGAFCYRILVVEDDEQLNGLFCHFLQSRNFNVCPAYGLSDALNILTSEAHIDLIMLDYQLGDGNGLALLAALSAHTFLSSPPVIMISSNEDADFLEHCFASGASDYLIKPVNLVKSVAMQKLITLQNAELERFKQEAEREEAVAKLTYEYLLRENSEAVEGVSIWLKSSSPFSGDIALARVSPAGDFYFLLADATGHGLSAAITVIPLVSVFNSMVSKGFHIQDIVTEINKKLIRDTPQDRFVAAIAIQFCREQKKIDVWNGGMPAAYWMSEGKMVQEFRSRYMPLGILEEGVFDACPASYALSGKGGGIVVYSDGLTEELNAKGQPFSSSRVLDTIQNKDGDVHFLLAAALREHAGKDQFRDDVSICLLDIQKIFFCAN